MGSADQLCACLKCSYTWYLFLDLQFIVPVIINQSHIWKIQRNIFNIRLWSKVKVGATVHKGASNTPVSIFSSAAPLTSPCKTVHRGRLSIATVCRSVMLQLWRSQSRGCGSAIGIVCRTSSSNCRALCRWISIQQGVSLMLWRG